MLRSLYSGISGLRAHQTMLDVTGNNIANVNTAGFKASSTQFQDTLSQMTQGASAPQGETGGSNPAQIGLGVRVAGVSTNFAQGSSQSTGRATDMMISGDGFFVTSKGGQQLFTRAGASMTSTPPASWSAPTAASCRAGPPRAAWSTRRRHRRHHAEPEHHGGHRYHARSALDGNLPSDAGIARRCTRVVKVYDAAGAEATHPHLRPELRRLGRHGQRRRGATTATLTHEPAEPDAG